VPVPVPVPVPAYGRSRAYFVTCMLRCVCVRERDSTSFQLALFEIFIEFWKETGRRQKSLEKCAAAVKDGLCNKRPT